MATLNPESWEDYDNAKIHKGLDKDYFCCEEKWEVDYLKNQISKLHPEIDEKIILFAIYFTYTSVCSSKKRAHFIDQVSGLLEIPTIPCT